ncbi:hypothetical protein KPATCC21470_8375 [Kitasatospora purpeofusca]
MGASELYPGVVGSRPGMGGDRRRAGRGDRHTIGAVKCGMYNCILHIAVEDVERNQVLDFRRTVTPRPTHRTDRRSSAREGMCTAFPSATGGTRKVLAARPSPWTRPRPAALSASRRPGGPTGGIGTRMGGGR